MPSVNRIQELVGMELYQELESMVVVPKWNETTEAIVAEYYGKIPGASIAQVLNKINPTHKYNEDVVRKKAKRLRMDSQ